MYLIKIIMSKLWCKAASLWVEFYWAIGWTATVGSTTIKIGLSKCVISLFCDLVYQLNNLMSVFVFQWKNIIHFQWLSGAETPNPVSDKLRIRWFGLLPSSDSRSTDDRPALTKNKQSWDVTLHSSSQLDGAFLSIYGPEYRKKTINPYKSIYT